MSEMNYADWLQAQFTINKNKSKAGLAHALGLEPPAISKILNGSRQVKAREYVIMRHFFGLPSGETHAISPPIETAFTTDSLSDSSHGGGNFDMPEGINKNSHESSTKGFTSFVVHDDYMKPEFESGDSVLVNTADTIPSPAGIFVVSDKFSHMVRHCEIIPHSTPSEIKITALDPAFQTQTLRIDDFDIIGRVVAKVTWLDDQDKVSAGNTP